MAAVIDHASGLNTRMPSYKKTGKLWTDLTDELESDNSHCQGVFHFVKDYGNWFPNKLSQDG